MIIIFFLLLTAFFSLSETSLFSLSKFTIRAYKYDCDMRKRMISHLMSHPRNLLVTIMMLNIFSNILVQNTISNSFKNSHSWVLKVGVPLVLVLFIGDIIPKSIAISHSKKIAYFVAPFISFFYRIFSFFTKAITKITDTISRGFWFFIKKEKEISSEELYHIIEESKKTLHKEEKKMIKGYLDLIEANVKEKKKGKEEIVFYDVKDPFKDLLNCFIKKKRSKILVTQNGLENILGVITLETFFQNKKNIEKEGVQKYLKKPFYIPETTNAWEALYRLKEKERDLAVIVDEYGCITGVITREDLTKIVFGEMQKEKIEEPYIRSCKDVIIAKGILELSDFSEIFQKELRSETGQLTLGGWLIEKMDRIPKVGEQLNKEGFLFYILEASANKIDKIYIKRMEK